MANTNIHLESNCHFFRIAYASGEERWVAFDTSKGQDLPINEMKKLIEQAETKVAPEKLASVWYMGRLALWKAT